MRVQPALLCLLMWTACNDKEAVDTGEPELLDNDTDEPTECSGTAPVIETIDCIESDPQNIEGTDYPTLTLRSTVTDEDGDLTSYSIMVYFDDVVDGVVDTSDAVYSPYTSSLQRDECAAPEAELGLRLAIPGVWPDYETEYEWGLVVSDAGGLASEMAIVTCATPASL